MKLKLFATVLAVLFLCSACVRQAPVLSADAVLTDQSPAVPVPLEITAAAETASGMDALGNRIESEEHYARYVRFSDLRVYEYNDSTFLDGTAVNEYAQILSGTVQIVYCDKSGTEIARADLYVAECKNLKLQPGENRIYAEIGADTEIQMNDFTIEIVEPFLPAE